MMIYKKHLSEPWFTLIQQKKKTSEGRLNKGDFHDMNVGDIIEFTNSDTGKLRKYKVKITSKHRYKSFRNMITREYLKNVLPDPSIETIKQGVDVYYKFYNTKDEKKYGIIAIRIKLI